ncbi:MAG: hypothetical protein LWW86_01140 [Micrococcales bacterium]|nr:hypothetical protein [Micrococcales bacterium]
METTPGRDSAPLRALTGRGRSWLGTRSIRQLGVIAFLAALLVSGLFGGLEQAPADPPKAVVAEQPVTTGPLVLTVAKAKHGTDLAVPGIGKTPGRYLLLAVDAKVVGDEPLEPQVLKESVRLEDAPGLVSGTHTERPAQEEPAPYVINVLDGGPVDWLAPGIPYQLAMVWEQQPGAPLPQELTVQVRDLTHRPDSITQQLSWRDPVVVARGRLPLSELGPA